MPGEDRKTQATVASIHDAAFEHRLERSSLMLALGGGVVGDMTGFAAATWLRGIRVIQVPTTLLAMVDAAIGGHFCNAPAGAAAAVAARPGYRSHPHTCLLYTSPSPRDRQKSRMPSSA